MNLHVKFIGVHHVQSENGTPLNMYVRLYINKVPGVWVDTKTVYRTRRKTRFDERFDFNLPPNLDAGLHIEVYDNLGWEAPQMRRSAVLPLARSGPGMKEMIVELGYDGRDNQGKKKRFYDGLAILQITKTPRHGEGRLQPVEQA
ncbi:hypothetical protein HDU89_007337 [Geranomyces variabilis]|nr:hypothetical protein HDU89_007337 [Geranomyces variabilis]